MLFKSNDELFSRHELLYTFLLSTFLTAGFFFVLKKNSGKPYSIMLAAAMLASMVLCLWLENNHPVILIPPKEITIQIMTVPDSPVKIEWAYWSQPDGEITDEINDWDHVVNLHASHMDLSGDWQESAKPDNICSGNCVLKLPPDIHFHRPVIVFRVLNDTAQIQCNEDHYILHSGTELKIFATGSGISRQLVFIILFLCVSGCLLFPAGFLTVCITSGKSYSDRAGYNDVILYFAAFLIPVILTGSICYLLRMWPFGERTFLITDMRVQYTDYLIYLKGILQGKHSLFYSFSKSIGDDFLGLYAYYLGNPLNWIIAFFPVEHFPQAICIIVLMRYGLCGFTSAIFFRKVFGAKGETIIFSTAYALISLQLVIAEHIQLRDGAIFLPLILLGIEKLIRKGHSGLYIITLSAALLVSYYSAYQICFFCVLYFLFRTIMDRSLSRKTIGFFMASSLTAAGLCAAFLIPVAVQLTKGMKTFDPSQFTFTLNMRFSELAGKLFNSAFDMDQTLTSGFPNLFCGLFITVGIPLFYLNRNVSGREKRLTAGMLIIFILAMQIRALNLILHGFNEPVWWPYRYSFIICLFLIMLALRCYQERSGITVIGWGVSLILITCLLLYIHAQDFSWFSDEAFCLNLLLCLCMFILWMISAHTDTWPIPLILLLCAVDLICNGWMILSEKTAYQRSETIPAYLQYFSENRPVIEELKAYDGGFYRVEKTYTRDANDAMTLDYHGIGHYSSTLNYSLMKFLPKMGYRYYPWRFLYGEGTDLAADSLLGIRYLISDGSDIEKPYPEVFSASGKKIYRNPYSLPIAFFGKDIRLTNPDAVTFELQNDIFRALSGKQDLIYTEAEVQSTETRNLRISTDAAECYERINRDEPAAITWTVMKPAGERLYLYFRSDSDKTYPLDIMINGAYQTGYFDGQGIPIIQVRSEDDNTNVMISAELQKERVCLNEIQFYSENPEILEKYTFDLQNSSVLLQKNSDTAISGEIYSGEDGYLVFTIPYDNGWKIWIDGEKTKPEKAFDIFLSASVSGGNHNYLIKYLPEGLELGIVVSFGTVILLILNKKRRKNFPARTIRGNCDSGIYDIPE